MDALVRWRGDRALRAARYREEAISGMDGMHQLKGRFTAVLLTACCKQFDAALAERRQRARSRKSGRDGSGHNR